MICLWSLPYAMPEYKNFFEQNGMDLGSSLQVFSFMPEAERWPDVYADRATPMPARKQLMWF